MVVKFRNAVMIAVGEPIVAGGGASLSHIIRMQRLVPSRLPVGTINLHTCSCKKNTFTIDNQSYWGISCICSGFGTDVLGIRISLLVTKASRKLN